MNRVSAMPRRRIATMALLLASFLEICGCNPVRSCEQLRATRLSAVPWESLAEQCTRCLSARELIALRQMREASVVNSVPNNLLRDATVQESLGEANRPSFDVSIAKDRDNRDAPALTHDEVQETVESISDSKPIAWPISESVLFLYAAAPMNGEVAQRIATGFILSLVQKKTGDAKFLVTARHVVDPEWAGCGRPNPPSITLRLNQRMGGVTYRTITLERNHHRQFVTSPDEAIDLALIPLDRRELADLDDFKLAGVAIDSLPTESELGRLHEAQQIATVGVAPPNFFGLTDLPISESGMIASAAQAVAVPVRCAAESPAKSIRIWMIDASVERGLSGAPVYAAFARGPHHASIPLLVGIQAAVWPDRGEAGVTPVAALLEMIEMQRNGVRLALNQPKLPPG